MNRKIKILNHSWHTSHQYHLMKTLAPLAEFWWLRQYKRPHSDKPRGVLPLGGMVNHYEPGFFDLALLHLDQQCLEPELWKRGKGRLYRELNEIITDIPKIVICHGTPYYPEQFPNDITNDTFAKNGISSELIGLLKEAVGENTLVVNSHTAAKQWGFGTPIIHGLDPAEWWDLPKERRVVTMISPGGLDMYYDRQFFGAVRELLLDEHEINLCHITVDWQAADFDDYRNFLGRSLVYFNPTRESPMPRARTEAMLSGACVITTPNQDADTFIEDGVNGFIVRRDPTHAVKLIVWALKHYDEAKAIGQKGKQTAIERFGFNRYQEDWRALLSKVLGREIIKVNEQ